MIITMLIRSPPSPLSCPIGFLLLTAMAGVALTNRGVSAFNNMDVAARSNAIILEPRNAFLVHRYRPVLHQAAESDAATPFPEGDGASQGQQKQQQQQQLVEFPPTLLDPFPQAADPLYAVRGPVGGGDFVVSRHGEPTREELTDDNILRILVRGSNVDGVTDLEVNTLVWKCLGYRFDPESEVWTAEKVFPKWKERFPTPPDLIGMQRTYSKEVDGQVLKNNQHLVRSVPAENKQGIREHLRPLGFTGYKLSELTPNLTRRAQCSNWLLYYRDELFGVTMDELKERRRLKQQAQEEERSERKKEGQAQEWKPPVTEVF